MNPTGGIHYGTAFAVAKRECSRLQATCDEISDEVIRCHESLMLYRLVAPGGMCSEALTELESSEDVQTRLYRAVIVNKLYNNYWIDDLIIDLGDAIEILDGFMVADDGDVGLSSLWQLADDAIRTGDTTRLYNLVDYLVTDSREMLIDVYTD